MAVEGVKKNQRKVKNVRWDPVIAKLEEYKLRN